MNQHPYQRLLSPMECPAAILAGGRSSRFGSDKALVDVAGQPLLLCLRDTLLRLGHAVMIVADRSDRYRQLEVTCWVDHRAECGPLSGVATALQQRLRNGPGWLLLLSCDQLAWRHEWFEQLALVVAVYHDSPPLDVVHFVSQRREEGQRTVEPLPCLLHTRLLPRALGCLERDQLSLRKFIGDSRAQSIVTDVPPRQWTFNTPDELRRLESHL